jgi:hypothetical protein
MSRRHAIGMIFGIDVDVAAFLAVETTVRTCGWPVAEVSPTISALPGL